MSWGTYYKFEGYLSRIGKHELDEEIDTKKEIINALWDKILALAAYNAGSAKHKKFDPEKLVTELREIRESIEDNVSLLARLFDAKSAQEEDPLNVHDDNDKWDDEGDDWADVVEAKKKAQSKIE